MSQCEIEQFLKDASTSQKLFSVIKGEKWKKTDSGRVSDW